VSKLLIAWLTALGTWSPIPAAPMQYAVRQVDQLGGSTSAIAKVAAWEGKP
jgi:hypothetical protein